ncbi:Spy/CpxP family protein refolding chaperone [Maridesulfovibrio frigidus]|uniref:Spy/CpxP family protein refolding chaperone n=1 Tax=Maridesulfovibrio frigidus TaxID=340956 RepID=UPI0004E0CB24|nr:periplasmic heavy metal sensor [Maridesulfovibrio frigidus]
MTKKTLIPLLAIFILSIAAVAMARGGYHGGGNWDAYEQLTPEKQQQVQAIIKNYEPTFEKLKSQQWAKRTELNALVESGKADKETIHALVKDLSETRDKMYAAHKQMASEIEKETGLTFPAAGMGPRGGKNGCGKRSRSNCGGSGSQNCPGLNS